MREKNCEGGSWRSIFSLCFDFDPIFTNDIVSTVDGENEGEGGHQRSSIGNSFIFLLLPYFGNDFHTKYTDVALQLFGFWSECARCMTSLFFSHRFSTVTYTVTGALFSKIRFGTRNLFLTQEWNYLLKKKFKKTFIYLIESIKYVNK